MRYMTLSSWYQYLEKPDFVLPASTLIVSGEPYAIELGASVLLKRLRQNSKLARGIYSFDAEEGGYEAFCAEQKILSFLSPVKVLVLRNADKLSAANVKHLDQLLIASTQGIHVIILAAQYKKNSAFYTACEEQGLLLEIPLTKGVERERTWGAVAVEQMRQFNKTLPLTLAKHLVRQLPDISYLSSECDKLLAYVGERSEITHSDLEAVCVLREPQSIWQLGEAIFKRDLAKALTVLQFLLDSELSPFALIASLRHQLHTGCLLAELIEADTPRAELAKRFPQLVGRLLDEQCRHAGEYGVASFHKALSALNALEFHLKDRPIDPEHLLKRLLVVMTQPCDVVTLV